MGVDQLRVRREAGGLIPGHLNLEGRHWKGDKRSRGLMMGLGLSRSLMSSVCRPRWQLIDKQVVIVAPGEALENGVLSEDGWVWGCQ